MSDNLDTIRAAARSAAQIPLAPARALFEAQMATAYMIAAGGVLTRAAHLAGMESTGFRRLLRRNGLWPWKKAEEASDG